MRNTGPVASTNERNSDHCQRGSSEIAGIDRAARKARNLARYKRRYARHKPVKLLNRWRYLFDPPSRRDLAQCSTRGFVPYMQQLVRMRYGEKGKWGRGKYVNPTKAGPGRRPVPRIMRLKAIPKLTQLCSRRHKYAHRLHRRLTGRRAA